MCKVAQKAEIVQGAMWIKMDLREVLLHSTGLHRTSLHRATLHCASLHRTSLHRAV